jgi:hypothetical protein
MDQHDRVVGEVWIEVVDGRVAAFREESAVESVADDPLALSGLALLDVLLEGGDDSGDVLDSADRWPGDVHPVDDLQGVAEVAVTVDEGGTERPVAQIHDPRGAALVLFDKSAVPDGEDPAVLHGERLGPRFSVRHRENVAADEDEIREVGRAGGGIVATCRNQRQQHATRDSFPHGLSRLLSRPARISHRA